MCMAGGGLGGGLIVTPWPGPPSLPFHSSGHKSVISNVIPGAAHAAGSGTTNLELLIKDLKHSIYKRKEGGGGGMGRRRRKEGKEEGGGQWFNKYIKNIQVS